MDHWIEINGRAHRRRAQPVLTFSGQFKVRALAWIGEPCDTTAMQSLTVPYMWRIGVFALLALGLAGCGARSSRPVPKTGTAQQRADFDQAVRDFDTGNLDASRRRLEMLLRSARPDGLRPYITYYLGRIEARKRPANGATALLALGNTNIPLELKQAARLHGSVAAARAGQCGRVRSDAHRLVKRIEGPDRADAELGLAQCVSGATALARYKAAAEADPARATEARAAAEALVAKTQNPDRRMMAIWPELFVGRSPVGPDPTDPRGDLPPPTPASDQARLGVVVPLSGQLRGLGERLAAGVEARTRNEDDPNGPGPVVSVQNGATAEDVDAAFDAFADQGVFAVVGLFDRSVAAQAAQAAATRRIPLVMLTSSDIAVSVQGPIWRALHTPSLVARTAAGAGLMQGGRRAAILRPKNTYGSTLSRWFAESWKAGGGQVVGELAWNPRKPNWARLAKRARRLKFDTLFLPCDGRSGAQLLSHLAAEGTWVRGARSRFKRPPKDAREVFVIGTPEWYGPTVLKQARRYAEGLMVPVPFAVETARGAAFAERLQRNTGNPATAFDALVADALEAFRRAHAIALKDGLDAASALRRVRWDGGHTAGLDFTQTDRDAVQALFLLVVSQGRFTPLQ